MGKTSQQKPKRPRFALLGAALVLACLVLALAPRAHAYVRSRGMSSQVIYWNPPSVAFQANPVNASGLTAAEVETAFRNAFDAWTAFGTTLNYSYSQSNSVPPVSGHDGRNAIYFTSQGGGGGGWFNVIAVTEVIYYTATGQIAGADIAFNDNDFLFTANPGDTGQIDGGTGMMKVFLGDVAAHEAGHAWGLDHSTIHRSSLIFTAFSGQYQPGRDDRAAIRSLYPQAGAVAASSAIVGTVRGANGGIFGAHVAAIDLATGRVESGALALPDGSFRIGDIPPGSYALLIEPFLAGTSTVSYYYNNVSHYFCGGAPFKRAFYAACGANGQAATLTTTAGSAVSAGVVAPSCSTMANAGTAPTTLAAARDLPAGGGAAFGAMNVSGTHYWKITIAGGTLAAKAMSYTLFSPLDIRVRILDSSGVAVPGAVTADDVETPMAGGYTNYDASAEAAALPAGTYYLEVSAGANLLMSNRYPAGSYLLDGDGFYFLSATVNGTAAATGAVNMSACATVPNVVQSGIAIPLSSRRTNADSEGGGGCATVTDGSGSGGNTPPGFMNLCLALGAGLLAQIAVRLGRLARA